MIEYRVKLNQSLISRFGLTAEEVEKIQQLHEVRLDIKQAAGALDPSIPEHLSAIKTLYHFYIQNQFDLQRAWKFDQNGDFHDWHHFPHCKCPKLDNDDRKGTRFRIYNSECPIHGPYIKGEEQ